MLGVAMLAVACGPPPDPERPHLVMLMLDAARADFFGSYGYPYNTTPEMDRLAAGGIRFDHHVSHGHTTRQSVPQLFTSRYDAPSLLFYPPGQDEPWWRRDEVPQDDLVLLTDLLADAGYRTVMVTAHPWTSADSRLGESFQEVHFVKPKSGPYADAQALVTKSQEVLKQHRAGEGQPLFLYVHFLDTHTPHNPAEEDEFFSLEALGWNRAEWARKQPARKNTKFIADPDPLLVETFKGAVRSSLHRLDAQVGVLMRSVKSRLGSKVVGVITADHGDALGESGHFEHTLPTFGMDAVHHIPMLLFGHGVPEGKVAEGFTGTVDVMPTLLSLAEIEPPEAAALLDGQDLLDGPVPEIVVRDWVPYTFRAGWRSMRFGFREADHTWILNERQEIYRLTESEAGPMKESLGTVRTSGAELPREFKRFIKTFLDRESARKVDGKVGAMHIPAREIESPLGAPPPCWNFGDIDDWQRKLTFTADGQESCPPLALRVAAPDGAYQAKWRLNLRQAGPKIYIRHSRGQTVITDITGETDAELGEIEVRDGYWRVDVQVQATSGAKVVFGALDWQRSGQAEQEAEMDEETLEQLKSLGYLD